MGLKNAGASIEAWFTLPSPQYVPLADVGFGPLQPVLPHQLPPSSMVFPLPSFNKMLNIPSAQTVMDKRTNTGRF